MTKHSDGGKGDRQRPTDQDKFRENWQKIFGDKRKKPEVPKDGKPNS